MERRDVCPLTSDRVLSCSLKQAPVMLQSWCSASFRITAQDGPRRLPQVCLAMTELSPSSLSPTLLSPPLTSRTKAPRSDTPPSMAVCELAELFLTTTLIFSPAGKRLPLVPAHEPQAGMQVRRGAELKVQAALLPWETSLCSTAFIKEMETCHILSATISDIIQAICPRCVSRNS